LNRRPRAEFPYRTVKIALCPGVRQQLHRRIEQRFDSMLEEGLLDELRDLRARYALNATMPSMRSVGYRQAWRHLEGEFDYETLRAKGAAATRQLAKRQLTWMRAMRDLTIVDCLSENAGEQVLTLVGRQLRLADRIAP
jgi:tRNA dimethylallyltransferase